MPNPFSVATETDGEIAVIHLEGAVDAHTAPKFEEAVQTVIDEGRNKIVVDCERMTYISSAGLGVFMCFIEEVRDENGDIKICGLSEKVKQPFEILGFESLYDFCPDVESAKRRFDDATAVPGGAT
jgi:anti-sigma B factor antagonist